MKNRQGNVYSAATWVCRSKQLLTISTPLTDRFKKTHRIPDGGSRETRRAIDAAKCLPACPNLCFKDAPITAENRRYLGKARPRIRRQAAQAEGGGWFGKALTRQRYVP